MFFGHIFSSSTACLCLSEILKQVWDLSDQDNDSMLSLREFCIALYLLERYREGRTLPTVLPSNILFDQPGQQSVGYANAAWAQASGTDGTTSLCITAQTFLTS